MTPKEQAKYNKNAELIINNSHGGVIPTVGMGATSGAGSDRYPHTIVEVSPTLDYISVTADTSIPEPGNDFYNNQSYTYKSNIDGERTKYTLRKNGRYIQEGQPLKAYYCSINIGTRRFYQDPSF